MPPCKSHFKTWALDISDFHGLKHVVGATGNGLLRRFLWSICFLASSGYLLYIIYSTSVDYTRYEYTTTFDLKFLDEIEFPAVTFCNFNKYRQSKLTANDIVNVGPFLGITDENYTVLNQYLYQEEFVERMDNTDWSLYERDPNFNMTEFQIRVGHELDEMMVSCTYHGEECDNNYFDLILTHHGNCYTFNKFKDSIPILSSSKSGAANGLRLILDADTVEYTLSNDLDGNAIDSGFKMMVHDNIDVPYIKELGFSVAPGLHNHVSIRKEHITSLGEPYTDCILEEEINLQYYDHYTLQNCRLECETLLVQQTCGCRLVEQHGDYEVCSPRVTQSCAHPTLVALVNGQLSSPCGHCDNACEQNNFLVYSSASKLRSRYMEQYFSDSYPHNRTAEYISENFVAVTIYYGSINFQDVHSFPRFTPFLVMTIVGGNLGLWLGGSLLTFVQLIEYFVDELVITKFFADGKVKHKASSRRYSSGRKVIGSGRGANGEYSREMVSGGSGAANGELDKSSVNVIMTPVS